MKRSSVLQPVKAGFKNLMVRVPEDLFLRIGLLKDMAKDRGLRLDIEDAILHTLRSTLDRAETELGKLPSPHTTSTTKIDKAESKKASTSSGAAT